MNERVMFEHFLKYQNGDVRGYPSYEQALHEIIVKKRKYTHWIWYIVPYDQPSRQHGDLFVLKDIDVPLYLQNEQLRNNYIEIMSTIHDILTEKTLDEYEDVMTKIDLKKVYGSAVLFRNNTLASCSSNKDVINACDKVIYVLTDYIKRCKKDDVLNRFHSNLVKHFKVY